MEVQETACQLGAVIKVNRCASSEHYGLFGTPLEVTETMERQTIEQLFDLSGKGALVTGGRLE